jgi:hypothetical protein
VGEWVCSGGDVEMWSPDADLWSGYPAYTVCILDYYLGEILFASILKDERPTGYHPLSLREDQAFSRYRPTLNECREYKRFSF